MSARKIQIWFHAEDAGDADRLAREWVRAEPRLSLVEVTKVRRANQNPNTSNWTVTVVVRDAEQETVA